MYKDSLDCVLSASFTIVKSFYHMIAITRLARTTRPSWRSEVTMQAYHFSRAQKGNSWLSLMRLVEIVATTGARLRLDMSAQYTTPIVTLTDTKCLPSLSATLTTK